MTDIDIINLALNHCGCAKIASLADDSDEARTATLHWTAARDAVMEGRDWRFNSTRLVLVKDGAAPAFGFTNRFIVPTTIIDVRNCLDDAGNEIPDWQREGNFVLTDDSLVNAICGIRITDTTLYPPSFVEVLGFHLGANMCVPLTENRQRMLDLMATAEAKLKASAYTEGKQGRAERRTSPALPGRRR